MWIDLAEVIFQNGKCLTTENVLRSGNIEEAKRELPYIMVYNVLVSIPLCILHSFIVITLTYRTVINLIDFLFRNSSVLTRKELTKSSSDSYCLLACNINDENEIIYSEYDLNHVLNIFDSNKKQTRNNTSFEVSEIDLMDFNRSLKYCKIVSMKETKLKKLMNIIYKTDPNFRFTSRYLNSIMVSFIALYYFWCYFAKSVVIFATFLTKFLRQFDQAALTEKVEKIASFLTTPQSLTYGDICQIFPDILCIDSLSAVQISLPSLPSGLNSTVTTFKQLLDHVVRINFESSINAIFIVPLFVAYAICLGQLFMFMRESRMHLKQLYKGECEFVLKAKNLKNGSITSSSFHFGGYFSF